MDLLNDIQRRLKTRNLTAVSKETGISTGTLYGIVSGTNKNPKIKTLAHLHEWLKNN